jgi:DNA-binding response OmpR family regulator
MGDANHSRLRILLIDDDPSLTAPLAEALELLGGYEVGVAADGVTGLDQVFSFRPDCVVVDIRMPGINGYQFIRLVRGDSTTREIPLVVLSALAQQRDELAGLLSGADVYLFKPVDLDVLLRVVREATDLTAEQRQQRMRQMIEDSVYGELNKER